MKNTCFKISGGIFYNQSQKARPGRSMQGNLMQFVLVKGEKHAFV